MQSVKVNPDALHHHSSTAVLTLAAIGVVFGDIGTSPLYSLKECFAPEHGIPFSTAAVYGIISLIFWSLTLVVTLKYVVFVLRADNHGEGGVLSLMALALRSARNKPKRFKFMLMLGALGACML
ncbi:MAG: KUP/HAK/KT family potassium transporter, partial [Burkholderiaceae bacterium]